MCIIEGYGSLAASLLLHLVDLVLQLLGIGQVVMSEHVEIGIELVDEGNGGGDVELGNVYT